MEKYVKHYVLFLKDLIQIILSLFPLAFYSAYVILGGFIRAIFPRRKKSLEGEIILVTGSGTGIGRELCLELAMTGVKIVCWDIDGRNNEGTVKSLRNLGASAYAYTVDVSDRTVVESAAKRVLQEVGHVSIIVQNAGIAHCQEFLKMSPKSIEDIFRTNVLSHFWVLQTFLPKMIKEGRGHVVTMSSIGGLKANRYMVPYHGSKFAVEGYLESLKEEIRHHPDKPDIKFTTVYPHAVNTRMMDGIRCEFRFPFITPILDPKYVAKSVIDGMRRDKEFVYCPSSIPLFLFLEQFIPTRAKQSTLDYLMPIFEPISRKPESPSLLDRKVA